MRDTLYGSAKGPGQNEFVIRAPLHPIATDGGSAGNCLKQFRPRQRRCSSVKYGRIFPSRALLAARSATLGLGLVISRHSLS